MTSQDKILDSMKLKTCTARLGDVVQVLHRCCTGVAQMLYRCCTDVVQVLHRCCTDVVQVVRLHQIESSKRFLDEILKTEG